MSPCATAGNLTICRPNAAQPLTRFVDAIPDMGYRRIVRYSPRRQFRCHRCRARRWAKNLKIITGGGWYDPMVYCADKHRWRR